MSYEYKFRIDEMRDNHASKEQSENYPTESNVRNVCFVQPDGRMIFLSYGYLVSGEYLPEEGMIVLHFTSHEIVLKGNKLSKLYRDLSLHYPKQIVCAIDRYNALEETDNHLVNTITITPKA